MIYELERQFRRFFRKMRLELNELYGESVNSNEYAVLHFLEHAGAQKASAIASELRVSPSHITTVCDSLVKKGFVERYRCDQDRRVVLLCITERTKAILAIIEEKKTNYLLTKFSELSEEEVNHLLLIFKKLQ